MVLEEFLYKILKGASSDLQEQQKRNRRIRELDGGEEEYEARKSLRSISGIGRKTAGNLYDAGYKTSTQARDASIEDLKEIEGIGDELASDISKEGEIEEWEQGERIPYRKPHEAVEHIKKLKRERKHDKAEELLLWCIEKEEGRKRPAPAYFKHLAIIYRKDSRHDEEIEIIERYIRLLDERNVEPEDVGASAVKFVNRIDRARELAEKNQ